jgi:hypothetical protein
VVDSVTVNKQIRDVAEFLFNLLTSPKIHAIRYHYMNYGYRYVDKCYSF